MKFICDGIEYDSDDLLPIECNDEYALLVYASKDFRYIFAAFFQPYIGVTIKRLEGDSLRSLAERTHNADLHHAVQLEQSPGPSYVWHR